MRNLFNVGVVTTVLTMALIGCGKQETLKVESERNDRPRRYEPSSSSYGYTSPLRTCISRRNSFHSHGDYCHVLIKEENDSRCTRKLGKNVYWISCQQEK